MEFGLRHNGTLFPFCCSSINLCSFSVKDMKKSINLCSFSVKDTKKTKMNTQTNTRVVRKVLRLCLYLKVICMLYNKIHTDEQINVLCGTVEKYRVEK